jgi:hypothetical protein
MKEIKYNFLYCGCENFCDSILLRFRLQFRVLIQFRPAVSNKSKTTNNMYNP